MLLLNLIQRHVGLGGLSGAVDTERWRDDPVRQERLRLIDQIIAHNPSATLEFLDEFDTVQLTDYLDHLQSVITPRGRLARWSAKSHGRGITCRAAV